MSISVGKPAPDFELEAYVASTSEPRNVRLADYRRSWLVLFFYPRDFTFVCPTELQAFAELEGEFAGEGAALVASSTDSYWSHKAWFESNPLLAAVRYPVLADTAHALATAYGVLLADGSALRATFIVDPEGIVRHVSINDQSVGRSPDKTLRVLGALRTDALCPVGWRRGQPTLKAA
jgi:peroxiredoxin (alkyl hydroperoxide reductase subunit C)